MRILGMFQFLFKTSIVVFCLYLGVRSWLASKAYTFSEETVEAMALKYVGKDVETSYEQLNQDFYRTYPGHILPAEDQQWIFMNAGGWMGSMKILHASLTEYVLFFGTGIHTSGNSGRYYANISDTILNGTFRQWKEGDIHSTLFKPGDTVYHYWGEASAVEWSAGTWMVEYGRGFIPSTLGFALADTLFSTQDFVTLFYILRVYAKALMLEAETFILELNSDA
ncbi:Sigma non-opioid intracellular receptor 1 [Mactra antiquata]